MIINYAVGTKELIKNNTMDPNKLSERLKYILAKERIILEKEKNIIKQTLKNDEILNLTNAALDTNIMLSISTIDKKSQIEDYINQINKTMAFMNNTKDHLLNLVESLKKKEMSVNKTIIEIKNQIFTLGKLILINETFDDNIIFMNSTYNISDCINLNQRERILHNNEIYFKKEVQNAENFLKNVSNIETNLRKRENDLYERERYMNMSLEESNLHLESANLTLQDANMVLLEANETLYNASKIVKNTYSIVATISNVLDKFTKLNNTLETHILHKDIYKLNTILDIIDDINNQNNSLLTSMISKNLTNQYRTEYCKHLINNTANSDYILYIIIIVIFCCSTAIILYLIKIFVYKKIKYTINN